MRQLALGLVVGLILGLGCSMLPFPRTASAGPLEQALPPQIFSKGVTLRASTSTGTSSILVEWVYGEWILTGGSWLHVPSMNAAWTTMPPPSTK
jgi:hypothetical protein